MSWIKIGWVLLLAGMASAKTEWFEGGVDETGRMAWFAGEKANSGRLVLNPDSVFFRGRLRCVGTGDGESAEWNGGKSFAAIEDWDESDEMRWHLWFDRPGKVKVKVLAKAKSVRVELDGKGGEVTRGEELELEVKKAGRSMLSVRGNGSRLEGVILEGDAVMEAAVLHARWRPAATHAGRFESSEIGASGKKAAIWVMEMRPKLEDLTTYAPVTTPFGYFGSTFVPGVGPKGLNFSMWSYGRGKKEPPLEQLSRLVAVGDRRASFSGFGHEGTGVKPRGWSPFEGRKADRQVLALRVEARGDYHRYSGYFYDLERGEWRLYAAGEKWAKGKTVPAMNPGAFVEVPGPPHLQRTGDGPREMHFRGWASVGDGTWKRFDSMGAGHGNDPQNKAWWVTGDGWFAMRAGGMAHYRYPKAKGRTELNARFLSEALPPYLAAAKTKELMGLPVTLGIPKIDREGLRFSLKGAGQGATVRVFSGVADGASFAKRWDQSSEETPVEDGDLVLKIADGATHARALITTGHGSYWTDLGVR